MPSRFNAPVFAFLLVLAAYAPRFISSITSWPPLGAFLFGAFVLTIIGFVQERLLGSVIMLLVIFIAGPFQMFIVPFMHAASFGQQKQQAANAAQLSAVENSAPTPVAKGVDDVASSQQAAIKKYPSLAISNSPMNATFVARYILWKQHDDSRLRASNWPEVLADDCAANP